MGKKVLCQGAVFLAGILQATAFFGESLADMV